MEGQIEEFLRFLAEQKEYADNTIAAYRNDLNQFMRFLRRREYIYIRDWDEVTKDVLIDFILYLKEREYAPSTVARKVAAVKSFFHHLAQRKLIKEDPSADVESPRVEKRLPRVLSREEAERLLAEPAKDSSPSALRDRAFLELLYGTGMRVTELVSLNVDDVDLVSGVVRCRSGRQKVRVLSLPPRVAQALQEYLEKGRSQFVKNPDEPALFLNRRGARLTRQGLWLIIRDYVRRAGIKVPITPHTLRHSFAVHKLQDGASLQEVQKLLGHANVTTTQMYVDLEKQLRKEGATWTNSSP